jgi:hypothetical protein
MCSSLLLTLLSVCLCVCLGLPAVALGAITCFVLPTYPQEATWLAPADRVRMHARVQQAHRRAEAVADGRSTSSVALAALISPKVWVFALLFLSVGTAPA